MALPIGRATPVDSQTNYEYQFQFLQDWHLRAIDAIREQNLTKTAGLVGELLDFSIVNKIQTPELFEFAIRFTQFIADIQTAGLAHH